MDLGIYMDAYSRKYDDALQRVAYKSASKVFRSPNLSLMAKKSKKNMKAPGGSVAARARL